MDRADMDPVYLGDLYLGNSGAQHSLQLFFLAVKNALARSGRSAQPDTFSLLPGQCFLCPLAYQLTFYLGRDTERKGQYLTGDIITETVAVFHSPDLGADFHTVIENGHDREERPSEPADLGADDDIVFLDTFKQFAEPALVDLFCSAGCLADPFVYMHVIVAAEPLYFKSLILDRLTVSTDSDIPVNHTRYYVNLIQT